MYQTVFLKNSFIIILSCLLFSCSEVQERLPFYNSPDFTPHFLTDKQIIQDSITHHIADFSIIDQDSNLISQKHIEGKIHIASFIFTTCAGICPIMTKHLKSVNDHFKNNSDVVLLSFSVTPWIDSVPILKAFKENHDIHNPNWHFLTGSQDEIYSLARTSYFAEEDLGFTKDSADFLHTEHILLVDRDKRIRGIYNGTLALDIEQMIEDINYLLKEK